MANVGPCIETSNKNPSSIGGQSVNPCGAPHKAAAVDCVLGRGGASAGFLFPALKIPLPALNDGAGRERLFVVDRSDSPIQIFLRQR